MVPSERTYASGGGRAGTKQEGQGGEEEPAREAVFKG